MIDAIIFDFDYTLADSSNGVVESTNYALQSMGEPPQSHDACCATIGLSLGAMYERLTGSSDAERIATFSRLFIEKADEVMVDSTVLLPGVEDVIPRLASNGVSLGILSTKYRHRIESVLERQRLDRCFSVIVGGEDVERHKPDPQGLQLCLTKLSVDSERALMVGDSIVDAEAAYRGGVGFVAVLSGTTTADQFAAYSTRAILDSVLHLEGFLRESSRSPRTH